MIAVEDLIAPEGPLRFEFFEEAEVDVRPQLIRYIERGYEQATASGVPLNLQDTPAKQWALYLAFDALYLEKCNAPSSENQQEMALGSQSFHIKQIEAFANRAQQYKEAFETFVIDMPVPEPEPVVDLTPAPYAGGSFHLNISY